MLVFIASKAASWRRKVAAQGRVVHEDDGAMNEGRELGISSYELKMFPAVRYGIVDRYGDEIFCPNYSTNKYRQPKTELRWTQPSSVLVNLPRRIKQPRNSGDKAYIQSSLNSPNLMFPCTLQQKQTSSYAAKTLCDNPNTCAICLDKIGWSDYVRVLPCGHLHHVPCIDRWLVNCVRTCPLW